MQGIVRLLPEESNSADVGEVGKGEGWVLPLVNTSHRYASTWAGKLCVWSIAFHPIQSNSIRCHR